MQMDCGLLIKNIDRCLAKRANDTLIEDDITFSQLRFISYIYEKESQTASLKEMEKFYNVAQPTVAGIIKRLEKKGLITLSPDPNDRRAKNATLTDKGRHILERQDRLRQSSQEYLLRSLNDYEQHALMDMLQRIWMSIRDDEDPPVLMFKGSDGQNDHRGL